jgi:hypothetical protein
MRQDQTDKIIEMIISLLDSAAHVSNDPDNVVANNRIAGKAAAFIAETILFCDIKVLPETLSKLESVKTRALQFSTTQEETVDILVMQEQNFDDINKIAEEMDVLY